MLFHSSRTLFNNSFLSICIHSFYLLLVYLYHSWTQAVAPTKPVYSNLYSRAPHWVVGITTRERRSPRTLLHCALPCPALINPIRYWTSNWPWRVPCILPACITCAIRYTQWQEGEAVSVRLVTLLYALLLLWEGEREAGRRVYLPC